MAKPCKAAAENTMSTLHKPAATRSAPSTWGATTTVDVLLNDELPNADSLHLLGHVFQVTARSFTPLEAQVPYNKMKVCYCYYCCSC